MKQKIFPLESVRALKKRLEEDAARQVSDALLQLVQAKNRLLETENEMKAVAALGVSKLERSGAGHLLHLNRYMNVLEEKRKQHLEGCIQAEKNVALARAGLERVGREREVLDKLFERHQSVHRFHVAAQEQQWLDEIAARMKPQLLPSL